MTLKKDAKKISIYDGIYHKVVADKPILSLATNSPIGSFWVHASVTVDVTSAQNPIELTSNQNVVHFNKQRFFRLTSNRSQVVISVSSSGNFTFLQSDSAP